MKNFNNGDRVVVVIDKSVGHYGSYFNGDTGTVIRYGVNCVWVNFDKPYKGIDRSSFLVKEPELEHDRVYHSKLAQVLR